LNGLSRSRVPALLDHANENVAVTVSNLVLLDVPAGLQVKHVWVDTALLCSAAAVHGRRERTAGLSSQAALGVDERTEDRHGEETNEISAIVLLP